MLCEQQEALLNGVQEEGVGDLGQANSLRGGGKSPHFLKIEEELCEFLVCEFFAEMHVKVLD